MHVVILALLVGAPFVPDGSGIRVVDVGQGSALVAVGTEGDAILVDSGPAGAAEAIVHGLGALGVTHLDLVVHTHFDADHIGGISRVLAGADGLLGTADDPTIGAAWDRGGDDLPATGAVAAYFGALGDLREQATPGQRFEAPGLAVEVLDVPVASDAPENAKGIALCVDVGSLRVLVPGDLPADVLVLAASACRSVDVLWASHHGGADGTSLELLDVVDPSVVIVSAGMDNAHCHPATQTLRRLRDRTVWILGAAGLGPHDGCPPLADAIADEHRVSAGDLWLRGD